MAGDPRAGRPKGLRNRTTMAAEALLDGQAEQLTQKCIKMALDGDTVAMKLALDRIIPPRKGRAIVLPLPPVDTAQGVQAAVVAVVLAVTEGRISPEDGQMMTALLTEARRSIEATELESRIRALEKKR